MKIDKAIKRDSKINKRKNGMRVDNKSIFTIREIQKKKSDWIKKERKQKEEFLSTDL